MRGQQPSTLDQFFELSPDELDRIITAALQAQLAAGVTSVRDLGDYLWAVVDQPRAGADGHPEPTIVASGPPITIDQGHCWSIGGAASGVEGLRRAVRDRAERGADVVKIMTSGGAMTVGTDVMACQFSIEELRVVVDTAHSLELAVTAHAHALPAVEQCVAPGGRRHRALLVPDSDRIQHTTRTGRCRHPGLPDIGQGIGV